MKKVQLKLRIFFAIEIREGMTATRSTAMNVAHAKTMMQHTVQVTTSVKNKTARKDTVSGVVYAELFKCHIAEDVTKQFVSIAESALSFRCPRKVIRSAYT